MQELKPCPFCGGEASKVWIPYIGGGGYGNVIECDGCWAKTGYYATEAEAIAAWNTRAAMEFDNWFYLPKPKEPIAEVTETTCTWDGTKAKADVFYQVQEQAVINWAKELDEHIIKRICEVWGTRAERTCNLTENGDLLHCSYCGGAAQGQSWEYWNYCPNCGAKVVGE